MVSTRVSACYKSLVYTLMTNLPPKLGAMTASADFVVDFLSPTCRHDQELTSSQYHETIFTFWGPLVLFSGQYDESKTENILLLQNNITKSEAVQYFVHLRTKH